MGAARGSSACRPWRDRVAQTVVAMELERRVEPIFHPDSYGYRPGRSALDAVAACRSRCWKYGLGDRCSSGEGPVMGAERRGRVVRGCCLSDQLGRCSGRSRVDELKASRQAVSAFRSGLVWEAWEKVKANKGAPGADGRDDRGVREGSAGTTCTRSGTGCPRGAYFPPPVRAVEIEKPHGGRHEDPWRACRGRPGRADGGRQGCWSGRSSRSSIRTPTATGRGGPRWTRWLPAASGAGRRTG